MARSSTDDTRRHASMQATKCLYAMLLSSNSIHKLKQKQHKRKEKDGAKQNKQTETKDAHVNR